jgi:hypothetical protein
MNRGSKMKICNHLAAILNHELSIGNSISHIDEKMWSNAEYVVKMQNELDTAYITLNSLLPNCVDYWENNDTHYDFNKGYFCNKCKQGIISI